jgi:hypothetical protein
MIFLPYNQEKKTNFNKSNKDYSAKLFAREALLIDYPTK